ncbi:hypothetical protein KC949_00690 [Candidatus Saccharibacteria bacterium]|nr:hypothetical protein [Candidatus Saccharibacteria bacterium]
MAKKLPKQQNTNIERAPMPWDYGVSPDTELILDTIEKSVDNAATNLRVGVASILVIMNIIYGALIYLLFSSDSEFGMLVIIALYILAPFLLWGFVVWVGSGFDIGNTVVNERLKNRLTTYDKGRHEYKKRNDQEYFSYYDSEMFDVKGHSGYEITRRLLKYKNYEDTCGDDKHYGRYSWHYNKLFLSPEKLDWAIRFSQNRNNISKLLATLYLNGPNDSILRSKLGLTKAELALEMENLEYSLNDIVDIFMEASDIAVRHKLKCADDITKLAIPFITARDAMGRFHPISESTQQDSDISFGWKY